MNVNYRETNYLSVVTHLSYQAIPSHSTLLIPPPTHALHTHSTCLRHGVVVPFLDRLQRLHPDTHLGCLAEYQQWRGVKDDKHKLGDGVMSGTTKYQKRQRVKADKHRLDDGVSSCPAK